MNFKTQILSSKNINFIIFLYILSLYLFTYRVHQISNLLAALLILVIWLNYLLNRKESGRKIVFNKLLKIYLLFIAVCAISVIYAVDRGFAIRKVRTMILLFILIFSLANYIDTYDKLRMLMRSFVFSGLIASMYILIKADFSNITRFGSELGNVNAIGMILGISATFSLYFILTKREYYQSIFLLIIASCILLTGSRKAFLFIIMNTLIILFLRNNKGWKNKLKFAAIILLIVLIACYLVFNVDIFYEIIGVRLLNTFRSLSGQKVSTGSVTLRVKLIQEGWRMFKERPLLGHGLNNFRVLFARVPGGRETYAHNNFIELLVNIGVIGAGIYFLLQAYLIFELFKSCGELEDKSLAYVFIAVMISYLIISVTLVYYYNKQFAVLLIAAAMLTEIVKAERVKAE
ncbi:MAG TPA: O-antigen ligase family protein [Halanaerobiales bacterium]|nr:O-antigen ligase family protein [Halanaerobiales bacterium]